VGRREGGEFVRLELEGGMGFGFGFVGVLDLDFGTDTRVDICSGICIAKVFMVLGSHLWIYEWHIDLSVNR
jgi:hypothetical protein